MRRTGVAFAIGLFLLTLPVSAWAQEHATVEQDLDAMVTADTGGLDAARAEVVVNAADARADVLREAEAAFLLSAEDEKQLAVRPDRLDRALADSDDTITLKTTTIIIGLLALIVILAI